MTRRDIIIQILSEATGQSVEDAEVLFRAMIAEEMISENGLEEEFSTAETARLLEDFRAELPGIRRWVYEAGLLEDFGNA